MAIEDNIEAIYNFINNPHYIITADGHITTADGKELGYDHLNYLALSYNYGGKKMRLFKHRIIWAKFGNTKLTPDLVINHKDGNTYNNAITNLEQITQGENTLHRYRVLHHKPVIGNSKITKEQAEEIRTLRKNGWKYEDLMKKFKVGKTTISYVVNGKIWN